MCETSGGVITLGVSSLGVNSSMEGIVSSSSINAFIVTLSSVQPLVSHNGTMSSVAPLPVQPLHARSVVQPLFIKAGVSKTMQLIRPNTQTRQPIPLRPALNRQPIASQPMPVQQPIASQPALVRQPIAPQPMLLQQPIVSQPTLISQPIVSQPLVRQSIASQQTIRAYQSPSGILRYVLNSNEPPDFIVRNGVGNFHPGQKLPVGDVRQHPSLTILKGGVNQQQRFGVGGRGLGARCSSRGRGAAGGGSGAAVRFASRLSAPVLSRLSDSPDGMGGRSGSPGILVTGGSQGDFRFYPGGNIGMVGIILLIRTVNLLFSIRFEISSNRVSQTKRDKSELSLVADILSRRNHFS